MKEYFNTPIGLVVCEINDEHNISSCQPIFSVDSKALESSKEKYPKLAKALQFLEPCSDGFQAHGGKTPSFAPHFWEELARVPMGNTLTYGEFAEQLGLSRNYARVVGNILGTNECFLLLPCHRIVPATGGVGGFRWGSDIKQKLLEYESDAKKDK